MTHVFDTEGYLRRVACLAVVLFGHLPDGDDVCYWVQIALLPPLVCDERNTYVRRTLRFLVLYVSHRDTWKDFHVRAQHLGSDVSSLEQFTGGEGGIRCYKRA